MPRFVRDMFQQYVLYDLQRRVLLVPKHVHQRLEYLLIQWILRHRARLLFMPITLQNLLKIRHQLYYLPLGIHLLLVPQPVHDPMPQWVLSQLFD